MSTRSGCWPARRWRCWPAGSRSHPGQLGRGIIDGKACGKSKHPAAVALIMDARVRHTSQPPTGVTQPMRSVVCSGTLIAPDTVLTAAHCIGLSELLNKNYKVSDESYHVSFDEDLTNLASQHPITDGGIGVLPGDSLEARYWVAHPKFDLADISAQKDLGQIPDLGLMFLKRPKWGVDPAALISKTEAAQIVKGVSVRVVGWGRTGGSYSSSFGEKICADSKVNEVGTYGLQIGSDSTKPRKCNGDSGGPTFMTVKASTADTERLIGVTSRAHYTEKVNCSVGGIDTRVDAYLDWIDATMKKGCASGGRRSWCEVPGLPVADTDFGDGGGCSLGGGPHPPALPLFLLLALAGLRARRWKTAPTTPRRCPGR